MRSSPVDCSGSSKASDTKCHSPLRGRHGQFSIWVEPRIAVVSPIIRTAMRGTLAGPGYMKLKRYLLHPDIWSSKVVAPGTRPSSK